MLITLFATLMFFAMLAATFSALRTEMVEAKVVANRHRRAAGRSIYRR